MDLLNNCRCFTQQIAAVGTRSSLIRYSACAVAAKQLGQIEDPNSRLRGTRGQQHIAECLTRGGLDFNWYGSKYYERAILLLAKQISHQDLDSAHPSPSDLYNWAASEEGEQEDPSILLIAASMLSQYEMLSATVSMRAWTGHLNGIYKMFRHLNNGAFLEAHPTVPNDLPHQDGSSVQASFWYFVMNDLEESCKYDQFFQSPLSRHCTSSLNGRTTSYTRDPRHILQCVPFVGYILIGIVIKSLLRVVRVLTQTTCLCGVIWV